MRTHDWNNFHAYFPGGEFRRFYKHLSDRRRQLITDLDKVLTEQNFDLQKFYDLEGRLRRYNDEMYTLNIGAGNEKKNLTPEENERCQEIQALMNSDIVELVKLLDPVANRMMELGYLREELLA